MTEFQNNETIGIIKENINNIIDEKNVNYQDLFHNQSEDHTRVYKDSFIGVENSVFEQNNSKSVAVVNKTFSKKVV